MLHAQVISFSLAHHRNDIEKRAQLCFPFDLIIGVSCIACACVTKEAGGRLIEQVIYVRSMKSSVAFSVLKILFHLSPQLFSKLDFSIRFILRELHSKCAW